LEQYSQLQLSYNLTNVYVLTKTLGQTSEVKNGLIMLKLGTLVDWMNTWFFFSFFENLPFWALGTLLRHTCAKSFRGLTLVVQWQIDGSSEGL